MSHFSSKSVTNVCYLHNKGLVVNCRNFKKFLKNLCVILLDLYKIKVSEVR